MSKKRIYIVLISPIFANLWYTTLWSLATAKGRTSLQSINWEAKKQPCLKRNAQVFFFNWGQQCCFLFSVEFSDNFACIDSVNCFFFFSKQPIGQAIQTCLKRNAKVTTIGFFELLLPIATIGQFFFFSRRFGAASNITREVDDYGKEKKVFFLLI